MKKIIIICIGFATILASCNNVKEPSINADGSYTIKISAPSLDNQYENQVAPRSIYGSYSPSGSKKGFTFYWENGDKIIITPYTSGGAKLDDIEYEFKGSATSGSISITVSFPKDAATFSVASGPEEIAENAKIQPYVQNTNLSSGMMRLVSKKYPVGAETVEMVAKWAILLVQPNIEHESESEDVTYHIGFNNVVVEQTIKGTTHTFTYQKQVGPIEINGNTNLYPIFPVVVYPTETLNDNEEVIEQNPCSLKITVNYNESSFYGKEGEGSTATYYYPDAASKAKIVPLEMTSKTPVSGIYPGKAYEFELKSQPLTINWVVGPAPTNE